ncbi:MAG TPA: DUF899 family protein [Caulobacteraceae bacterium]|nr:DUF899 family protein [Caulobacteraceae bacterium]
MTYADTMAALNAKRAQITALQREMRSLQAGVEPQIVEDHLVAGWDGPVRLSTLFGDKRDLILIHNMGTGCPSCTMWADGFNGVYDHLASRAAFVVASPNTIEAQKAFAASRGWRFPMISYQGSRLAEELGYRHRSDDAFDQMLGGWNPGVSILRRDGERILRFSDTDFGPFDGFCVVYHLFDLVPGANPDWEPSYSYA